MVGIGSFNKRTDNTTMTGVSQWKFQMDGITIYFAIDNTVTGVSTPTVFSCDEKLFSTNELMEDLIRQCEIT